MTELRLLLPGLAVVGDLERSRGDALQALADLYAYPDPVPPAGYVRANMIATLDGSARDAAGSSRGISGPADVAVLGVLRALADVVLVGTRTARAGDYRPLPARVAFAERRAAVGQGPAAVVAVVTGSAIWTPARRWGTGAASLVVTCEAAPLARLRALAGGERVVVAGEESVDPVRAVAALADRGLRRVLVEGGPTCSARSRRPASWTSCASPGRPCSPAARRPGSCTALPLSSGCGPRTCSRRAGSCSVAGRWFRHAGDAMGSLAGRETWNDMRRRVYAAPGSRRNATQERTAGAA